MSNKKIVLFFPIIEEGQSGILPLSLLLLAAPLVEAGYEVKIIDQRMEADWKEKILAELKEPPLVFGVSAMTGKQILYGLSVSQLVKEKSNSLVVWGGVHPSLSPQKTLENGFVDLVVVGEGEKTFLELVDRLAKGQGYFDLPGIGYKYEGQVKVNPPQDFIDLSRQPEIPYQLIEMEKYVGSQSLASGKKGRDLSVYSSRGCPHRCAFCYNQGYNKRKWRGQSAERLFADIKKLIKKYQLTAISIQDDEFFTDFERVKKFCRLILSEDIKVEFISSCRVDYVCRMDDDFLRLIHQAGFKILEFGIESGSPEMLKKIKKDITVDQTLRAVAKLKEFGLSGKYCFMSGFPEETMKDVYQTTDLMRKIKKVDPYSRIPCWRIFTPFPGIDLYPVSIKEGWAPPKTLEEWAYYDFQTVKMPWVTRKMERIINNVSYLVQFLGLQDKDLSFWHQLLGRWVDFRWRYHWFSFVPEKVIIDLIKKTPK